MNKNKRLIHKVTVNVLGLTLASAVAAGGFCAEAPVTVYAAQEETTLEKVYLSGSSKKGDGSSKEKPVNSFSEAVKLAGKKGIIYVCGTIRISSEQKLSLPAGIQLKREKGFKGPVFQVVDDGKLTIDGNWLSASDVDTTEAKLGAKAFKAEIEEKTDEEEKDKEEKEEASKEETVSEEETDKKEESEQKEDTKEEAEETEKNEIKPEEEEPEKDETETGEKQDSDSDGEGDAGKEEEESDLKEETQEKPEEIQKPETEPEKEEQEKDEAETAEKPDADSDMEDDADKKEEESDLKEEAQEKPEEIQKPETEPEKEEQEKDEAETAEKPDADSDMEDDTDKKEEESDLKEETQEKPEETQKPETEPESDRKEEEIPQATPGKTGEVSTEVPEAIPVGSLFDEASQVQVMGDFIPFYVDLQVSWNEAVHELPDAGIGEILSAYELKLWDLKEDREYQIPDGKKVTVMIPLPENAGEFSDLAIAHYLGNNQYEYFSFSKDGTSGNMSIQEVNGEEYLVFETASFSPFNVGGLQLVGPGTGTSQETSEEKKEETVEQNNTANTGNSSAAVIPPQSTQNSNTVTNTGTTNKNSQIKVTHAVKTGDEQPVLPYFAAAAAAVAAAGAALAGKKRKNKAEE